MQAKAYRLRFLIWHATTLLLWRDYQESGRSMTQHEVFRGQSRSLITIARVIHYVISYALRKPYIYTIGPCSRHSVSTKTKPPSSYATVLRVHLDAIPLLSRLLSQCRPLDDLVPRNAMPMRRLCGRSRIRRREYLNMYMFCSSSDFTLGSCA